MQIVFSDEAYGIIEKALKKKHNKSETGGVLLGHKVDGVFCIVSATAQVNDGFNNHHLFILDGDAESLAAEKIMSEYAIAPKLLGVWHSHTNGNISFSTQDRLSNKVLADSIGEAVSVVVTCSKNNGILMTPYYIGSNGEEEMTEAGCYAIPNEFSAKREDNYGLESFGV